MLKKNYNENTEAEDKQLDLDANFKEEREAIDLNELYIKGLYLNNNNWEFKAVKEGMNPLHQ